MPLPNSPKIPKMRDYRRAQYLRMDIVAQLYKRGYTYREIREEVKTRLNLKSYSLRTVHQDIYRLLEEWRETRIEDFDLAVQLELSRIDELIKEAWAAWDKSKEDYTQRHSKQKGVPDIDEDGKQTEGVVTLQMEQSQREINQNGDPRYLDIIHKLLIERRKILGLYSPEKHDLSGNLTFANLLMETGIIDEEE